MACGVGAAAIGTAGVNTWKAGRMNKNHDKKLRVSIYGFSGWLLIGPLIGSFTPNSAPILRSVFKLRLLGGPMEKNGKRMINKKGSNKQLIIQPKYNKAIQ